MAPATIAAPPSSALRPFFFNIDVLGFGACNLTCPSCPVGNLRGMKNPKGLMEADMLRLILDKAANECAIDGVGLFNWTEPFLHPRLPELVRLVKSYGTRVDLSSNLNSLKLMEETLVEEPDSLRVSVSGFTQATYAPNHRGGDIEVVKANMRQLADMRQRLGVSTRIHVLYHRYRGNLAEERLMRDYCDSLRITFVVAYAFMQPLEKLLAIVDDDPSIAPVTEEDREVVRRLLVPLTSALQVAQRHRAKPCPFQEEQITLDCRGDVMTCCTVYDSARAGLGNYLTQSLEQIQAKKYSSALCTRCMDRGAHVYYTYQVPEFADLAILNALTRDDASYIAENPAFHLEQPTYQS